MKEAAEEPSSPAARPSPREAVVTLETVNALRDELAITPAPSDRASNLR